MKELIKREWLLLLIFVILGLGFPIKGQSQELTYWYSGFATYTYFSDDTFQKSGGIVAINGSVTYGDFAFKTQIANRAEPIRRWALEYSTGIHGDNLTFQYGRLPRLNTLFSDVYGNPAEWGMAVLPMSTYNRRKVHSLSFQAIEGIKAVWDHSTDWGGIRTTFNTGKPIQELDCEWQTEATRKPCNHGWGFVPAKNNFDVALEARVGANWTLLASYNKLDIDAELYNPLDRASRTYSTLVSELDYRFGRLGLRYDDSWGYLQTEHGESRLWFKDKRPGKGFYLNSTSWDDYYLGGFYVTEQITAFGGYSVGHERGSAFTSRDRFLGAIYRDGGWAYSAEFHNGEGSWQRAESTSYLWKSWALAATYSF